MKTFLVIFCLILTTNAFTQKKKDIIKKIDNYMNKTIYYAMYETNYDSLKSVIKQYFMENDFIQTKESDSDMTFYTKVPFMCSTYRYAKSYKYTAIKHKTCYRKAFVTVSIYDEKPGKNIRISWYVVNYPPGVWRHGGTGYVGYSFDELSLRKYLYITYYRKFIPFPEQLANSINDYNASQTKEQKKIVKSKNYYIY
ncbi:MAG: hypothetical protein ABII90_13325 [Bacteroidota bacterium]